MEMSELTAIAPNLCLSGGAIGADLQWGMCAGLKGHGVIHWTFADHARKCQAPPSEIVVLTQDQLDEADVALQVAKRRVKRSYPSNSINTNNLLRRNWYQVKDAERVYAIVENITPDGRLSGGTAWGVAMFMDRFDRQPCEAYVYDQETSQWYTTDGFSWLAIDDVPVPHGVWAGIGTRKLEMNGKTAIRTLLDYQKPLDL